MDKDLALSINVFCISSYLTFRYVANPNESWVSGIKPDYPDGEAYIQTAINNVSEIKKLLSADIENVCEHKKVGIFLSGGIDSAILAAFLPRGTTAYTIHFDAPNSVDERFHAKQYAKAFGLNHRIIHVSWDDYLKYEKSLMKHKKSPLHPVEVALYKAALEAKNDGLGSVIVGNGADSTFGGLNKLLAKDWLFDDFVERYSFINPELVLNQYTNVNEAFQAYRNGKYIDYVGFLKNVHGLGIVQSFDNALSLAGINSVAPYEKMKLACELDLERIRAGEPKYMLVELFSQLYPGMTAPKKVPFARPMDSWLENYEGPQSHLFKQDLDMTDFTGDQKYLIRNLDLFINMLEENQSWQ